MLVVSELLEITVNDFDAENANCYSRVFIVSELFVSGTRCILDWDLWMGTVDN